MTIATELRTKVVQMHLEGLGRNEISRILTQQGLHISEGSVGNIVRAYLKQPKPSSTAASTDTMALSPTSMAPYGIRQANSNFIPRDGGPLSHIFPNEPETDFASDISTPFPNLDPSDVFSDPNADYVPEFDGIESERRFNYQYTNTMNPHPNTTFPNNFNPYPNNISTA